MELQSFPIITVVTVCYNAVDTIEKTIQSVVYQTYPNVEYIIIDGGSNDSTVDVIKKYSDKISFWISEKDNGIYDAMNKAINKATGQWINFMNAGDWFYSSDSIKNVFAIENENVDVLYGKTEMRYDVGTYIVPPQKIQNVMCGAFCCHQSVFVRTSVMKKYMFSLDYKIISDWVLLRQLYIDGCIFKQIDVIVASFDNINGISSSITFKSHCRHIREKLSVLHKGEILHNKLYLCLAVSIFCAKKTLRKLIPHRIFLMIKRFKFRKLYK